MAEPPAPAPSRSAGDPPWLAPAPALGLGLALRLAAAAAVAIVVSRRGGLCLFPDAEIYWQLGRAIREGRPFAVDQWGVSHYTLRTPGYPLFLAACQRLFAGRTFPIRLIQACLGVLAAGMVGRLADRARPGRGATAAALAAVDPWAVGISAVLLSEAVFLPLMVANLWGLATLWRAPGQGGSGRIGMVTGIAAGAAILVKPSWALFPPAALAAWVVLARGRRREAARGAAAVGLGMVVAMAPWWARNARIYGRFVPTATWLGASLYDGLRPGATGASAMEFLDAPDVRALGEREQDAALRDRAIRFARAHPAEALRLAAIKAARYWSPWPNAGEFRVPWLNRAAACATLPLYALMLIGAWDCRRDPRALILLAGPILYFAAIHMVFVSSVRYRIPGELPAMGLAAIGAGKIRKRLTTKAQRTQREEKI